MDEETKTRIAWDFPEAGSHPDRKVQVVEIAVFLFLVVPSLAVSFFAVKQGRVGFTLTAVATILRDLALVSLIAFFLWRNKERFASIGWRAKNLSREIEVGVILFVPMFFFIGGLEAFLKGLGFSTPSTPLPSSLTASGVGESILAFILVCVVAVSEETIFRGYLILRFEGIGVKPVVSVVLSALIFGMGHGYEGSAGVVSIFAIGFIFAIVYLWRRSLVAPITMHFLQDFIGIVLLPLLRQGR
jgi:CAAX protease family protein